MLENVIRDTFKSKSSKIIEMNINAVQEGYKYVRENYSDDLFPDVTPDKNPVPKALIDGNTAVCIGALKAGLKFYSAYPMSPSTGILHYLASKERDYKIVVKQTEDEISAVNMAVGAMFAGVRAMTGTSGGGFSLMVEALGLAGMSETPLVIVLCQRPGPSTGLPTRTEQGDLLFALHASQGEFLKILIAPGDAEECFYEIQRAFNIAEKYQVQVILLLDAFICGSKKTVASLDTNAVPIERGLLPDEEAEKITDYKRYRFTESGVSPRAIPSQKNTVFIATGNEHTEDGHISENAENREKMVEKRIRKIAAIEKEVIHPELIGSEDAEVTIIGWGSTKGPILEAMKLLKNEGFSTNYLQILYLNPLPQEKITALLNKARKTVIVENNSTAQLAKLIREQTGILIENKILKYDGRQFFPETICDRIKEIIDIKIK